MKSIHQKTIVAQYDCKQSGFPTNPRRALKSSILIFHKLRLDHLQKIFLNLIAKIVKNKSICHPFFSFSISDKNTATYTIISQNKFDGLVKSQKFVIFRISHLMISIGYEFDFLEFRLFTRPSNLITDPISLSHLTFYNFMKMVQTIFKSQNILSA